MATQIRIVTGQTHIIVLGLDCGYVVANLYRWVSLRLWRLASARQYNGEVGNNNKIYWYSQNISIVLHTSIIFTTQKRYTMDTSQKTLWVYRLLFNSRLDA